MKASIERGKDISMLCRRYSTEEPLALGSVNAVVPDDALEIGSTAGSTSCSA